MKKIFTTISLLYLLISAQAQTFYTANFSGGIGQWTLIDNSGNNAGVWKYAHNPIVSAYYGNLTFKAASAGNGFALFMSDAATDDGKAENADFISKAINCSAYSYLHLEFDEWFVQRNASAGTLYISTDSVNWSLIYTIDATEGTFQHVQLDLTPFAANQSTVYLKFNYQGDHDFFWSIDDLKLTSVHMLDIAVDSITLNQYVPAGNNIISGILRNPGGEAINTVDMTYSINGGNTTSHSFSNLNLLPFGSTTFSFPQSALLDSFIKYTITINAFGPNSGTDGVMSNNTYSKDINALSAIPVKNVMLEEFTTSVCQFCPMGGTVVENISNEYSGIIPVAIHAGFNTDAMTTPDHSTINSSLGNGSAPALLVDRVYWDDAQDNALSLLHNADYSSSLWEDKTVIRKAVRSPLSIKASSIYDSNTRELTVDVSTIFYTKLSNLTYRVNCYIIEDSVTGTGSGYNQINYYANHENGAYNPWYGKGSPIVGFKHRHVGRYLFGGPWGTTGIIPATVSSGDVFSNQYTYTIPATWNANRVKLVAFVQDYSASYKRKSIINSLEYNLNSADSIPVSALTTTGVNEIQNSRLDAVSLFPNPTTGIINIDYTLNESASISFEVYNMIGEKLHSVQSQKLAAGDYRTQINTSSFQSGVYFVAVKDGNKLMRTLKFIVVK